MLQIRARLNLGAVTMKGFFPFPKTPESLESHHQIVLVSYPGLSLSGAVGIFYIPSSNRLCTLSFRYPTIHGCGIIKKKVYIFIRRPSYPALRSICDIRSLSMHPFTQHSKLHLVLLTVGKYRQDNKCNSLIFRVQNIQNPTIFLATFLISVKKKVCFYRDDSRTLLLTHRN